MNQSDGALAHALKIRFGTPPGEPNELQLEGIKRDVRRILLSGRLATDEDWYEAVYEAVQKHCPSAGHYVYKGLDNSDLITLLNLATKPTTP
jgi:hypothetical protein